MLKTLLTSLFLLFATPALALDFSGETPSTNIEDARTQCRMGTAEERLAEHRRLGQTILFLKPEFVPQMVAGINANLKANGKPAREFDGSAMVAMDPGITQIMIFQFLDGCVVSAVMAPSVMIFSALEKFKIPPDAWE
jgi:hypothetical protein